MARIASLVLVTGTGGNQGSTTARYLLAKGYRVRAMTHQPHGWKAAALANAGAEIVYGNLSDPCTLYSALEDVDGVFAVQPSRDIGTQQEEQRGRRLAYLAKEQDVRQFIYSSIAPTPPYSPQLEAKTQIEKTIRDLKFDSCTFLRGTFLMESFFDTNVFPEISSGKLICPVQPATKVQMVSAEDVAKFAVYCFENPQSMNGIELDLAGDEHTFEEAAHVLSSVLNKQIEFTSLTIDEFVKLRKLSGELRSNIEKVINWWQSVGWDVDIAGLMLASRSYGIDIRTLSEWASDFAQANQKELATAKTVGHRSKSQ